MSGAHLAEELRIDEHEEPLVHWLHVLIRVCVRLAEAESLTSHIV